MNIRLTLIRGTLTLAQIFLVFSLAACSRTEAVPESSFVGAWKSSKAADTPISIYGNGEWEVKSIEGKVMQYGVWQIVGQNKIMWSYKDQSGRIMHDVNPVLSVTPSEFKVQEMDNTTTTFVRVG